MYAAKDWTALSQLNSDLLQLEKDLIKRIQENSMSEQSGALTNAKKNFHTPIAIIGIGSIFPSARNLEEYWTNILRKTDCITEVPISRWDTADYYDPDPKAIDKTYCNRGGFIPDIPFNPIEFGLPPNLLEITDISQLLGLEVAKVTMEDAGYGEAKEFERDRTGIVLGVTLARQLSFSLFARLQYPVWQKVLRSQGLPESKIQEIVEKIKLAYVGWEENSFPGALANVVAGRIANRFNLGGMNCVVDAACASSFGALKMAMSELIEHRCDMMLTGGIDTDNTSSTFLCFSKTPALSLNQQIRPFDTAADGMLLGEGVGMMLLKRLEDAERDGDKIYAIIRGIGTSSDGRSKSIYAPRSTGQRKALQRAYEDAGFSPATIGLLEAHGTATIAGDRTEFSALREVFEVDNSCKQSIALGSVKSQIGHTKAAAGAASLIKAALALHHKVLPPTINVTQPNPRLNIEDSAFYINTETRPWIRTERQPPRRAGISSFGFGGTNYHVVLEEYEAEQHRPYRLHCVPQPILLVASTPKELLLRCQSILQQLQAEVDQSNQRYFEELVHSSKSAYSNIASNVASNNRVQQPPARLGFVADSVTETSQLLQVGIALLEAQPQAEWLESPQGVYYSRTSLKPGKIVALFPGQGSQYLNMGQELATNFPIFRELYSHVDQLLQQDSCTPLSQIIFPPPAFTAEQRDLQSERLQRTEFAQLAIATMSVGLFKLLQEAGFKPDFVAGHSFGELTALWAANVLSEADYFQLVKARGQAMSTPSSDTDANTDTGMMLAVKATVEEVKQLIQQFPQVTIANFNAPRQIILAGGTAAILEIQQACQAQGYSTVQLPVSAAFHTLFVQHAQKKFSQAIQSVQFNPPQLSIYSNLTGQPSPLQPAEIQKNLVAHLTQPVRFQQAIENLYADGAYYFVEFGPQSILTNLVKEILTDRPHVSLSLNSNRFKDSDRQFREAIVKLQVMGMPLVIPDPYEVPRLSLKDKDTADNSGTKFQVWLTGVNYVSEKTKNTFEQALVNELISPPIDTNEVNAEPELIHLGSAKLDRSTHLQEQEHQYRVEMNGSEQRNVTSNGHYVTGHHTNGHQVNGHYTNGHHTNGHQVNGHHTNGHNSEQKNVMETKPSSSVSNLVHQSSALPHSTSISESNGSSHLTQDNVQDFYHLKQFLTEFRHLQSETLQVHTQYLNHQTEYVQTCLRLMQQQRHLLLDDRTAPPDTQYAMQEAWLQCMSELHDFQTETSQIHEHYLNHGREQTQELLQLMYHHDSNSTHVLDHAPMTDRFGDRYIPSQSSSNQDILAQDTLAQGSDNRSSESSSHSEVYSSSVPTHPQPAVSQVPLTIQLPNLQQVPIATVAVPVVMPHALVPDTAIPAKSIELDQSAQSESAQSDEIPDFDTLSQSLSKIISEKTGYPPEVLKMDMDIEGDLGIDSIKRVEILGAMQDLYPSLPQVNIEELAELKNFQQVIHYLQEQATQQVTQQVTQQATQQVTQQVTQQATQQVASSQVEQDSRHSDSSQFDSSQFDSSQFDSSQSDPSQSDPSQSDSSQSDSSQSRSNISPASIPTTIQPHPVRLQSLPQPDWIARSLPEHYSCLVVDDGSPLTTQLTAALKNLGWKVVVLSFPLSIVAQRSSLPEGIDRVTLANMSEAHLQRQLNKVATKQGAIGAFIHLHPNFNSSFNPLSPDNSLHAHSSSTSKLRDQTSRTESILLQHIFLIAKHLSPALKQSAEQGYGCFLTVSHLDGKLGLAQQNSYSSISAGLFGLTKSLNCEWHSVFCRALDLSSELTLEGTVQCILAELHDPNRLLVEVGYTPDGRTTLACQSTEMGVQMTSQALAICPQPRSINAQSVFLVSGGAKGITAKCVIELAKQYHCKFILLGRSSIAEPEPDWARGCHDEQELKQQITQHLQAQGEEPTPQKIREVFQAIVSRREVVSTLAAIQQVDGHAEYLSVDVTDRAALQAQLPAIVQRLGSITGIIHGSGNLADKRIEHKTPQDFLSVYEPKVKGLENLLHCVSIADLDYLILFSSIVGFCGNAGQTDYAIANEVLNKTAQLLQRQYPHCHVLALNWGPWNTGMVTSELQQWFTQHQIETISPEVGVKRFMEALTSPHANPQILMGKPLPLVPVSPDAKLQVFEIHRKLTIAENPFLQDHRIGDRPVLPATCAMSWMITGSEQLYPGYCFFSQNNFKVLKGLIFDETTPVDYVLTLEETHKSQEKIEIKATISSQRQNEQNRSHFSTELTLLREIPAAVQHTFSSADIAVKSGQTISVTGWDLYQSKFSGLFHGATFQGVQRVLSLNSDHVITECCLPPPSRKHQGQFPSQTFNPFIADVQLHPLLIWSEHLHQQGCLPSQTSQYEQFAEIPFNQTFYVSTEITSKTRTAVTANVVAHDSQGQVYSRMLGAKGVILPLEKLAASTST